jgi:hypothetical protein
MLSSRLADLRSGYLPTDGIKINNMKDSVKYYKENFGYELLEDYEDFLVNKYLPTFNWKTPNRTKEENSSA